MRLPAAIALSGALLLTAASPASAQVPRPENRIEVLLATFGPGEIYWERFGHNALWVRDPATGLDAMFNYGTFDFDQEGFLLRFLQGRMLYSLSVQDPDLALAAYRAANRSIWIQTLDLTPDQSTELRDFLVWNARPEHRDYRYDYYYDNCSTRLRDVLDRVLGGAVRAQTATAPTGTTFRFHTSRLTAANVPYYTGLLTGLGQPVDRPITAWDEMFVPMLLRDHLRNVMVEDDAGVRRPLVRDETVLYASTAPDPRGTPPAWTFWYLLAGVGAAGLLLAMARFGWVLAFPVVGTAWAAMAGILGSVLAGLWLATDHAASARNENLFLLNPLWLALAVVLGPACLGRAWARRPARVLAIAAALLAAAALIVKLLPPFYQANGPLIALLLPVQVATAWLVWRATDTHVAR